MKNYCGFIVGKRSETIKNLIEAVMTLKAFPDGGEGVTEGGSTAGEGEGEGSNQKTEPTINYEDLIAKARREEKEKQYKTIEKLKGQVATLTEQHNNDLLVKADLERQLKEAKEKLTKTGEDDSETVKALKQEVSELETAKKDLETKVSEFEKNKPVNREEVEAEVRAELEAEYEVKTYKAEKMAELKDDILVPELVMGRTKAEIDASIQSALERSKQIKENLGIAGKKQARTPKSPTNASVSSVQDKEVSLERLATMDVRSREYAELRKQLGLR